MRRTERRGFRGDRREKRLHFRRSCWWRQGLTWGHQHDLGWPVGFWQTMIRGGRVPKSLGLESGKTRAVGFFIGLATRTLIPAWKEQTFNLGAGF